MLDPDEIRERIEAECRKRGHPLGWRLLSSPWSTTKSSRVAFIGLQPGGSFMPTDHPDLCRESGSAYVEEQWGKSDVGQHPLQRQVRALFERLNVRPEDVLAGNLVPFRAPNAASFPDMRGAIRFGEELWRDLLASAQPDLVITMSAPVTQSIANFARIPAMEAYPSGWGNVKLFTGKSESFRLVGLPHLSRFRIMTHENSRSNISTVFDERS